MHNNDKLAETIKHAKNSESLGRLNAMIELAKSEKGIPISLIKLDKNQYLYNCKNGTIDLKTGSLQPHNKYDYITKICNIDYNPDAKCDLWLKFLADITCNNKELVSYLQRIAGYCLTGDIKEQCMFILYGSGANGKTTFIEILKKILCNYSATVDISIFSAKQSNNDAKYELARIKGMRLISTSEPSQDMSLSENLIKAITGGDIIPCRKMYGKTFEYPPTFKPFILTNHKPIIKGYDYGIWRRINLIPFLATIPKENQDKDLPIKLYAELQGILSWMVRGCLEWQKNGLNTPETVLKSTEEYKEEMDKIADFINECCEIDTTLKISSSLLHERYCSWCSKNNIFPENIKIFGNYLENKGFKKKRSNSGRIIFGLTIKKLDYLEYYPKSDGCDV